MPKRTPKQCLQERAWVSLAATYQDFFRQYAALFRSNGLTAEQYNILRILNSAEAGLASMQIAERMLHRTPDITRMIDRLERAGLVERCQTREDRRLVIVKITDAGRERIEAIDPPLTDLHTRHFGAMDKTKLKTLADLLEEARGAQSDESD